MYNMKFWVFVVAAAFTTFFIVLAYNRLVAKRNRFQNAWAQIDVQLKRRHDLIPNLVDTVKGYIQHERGVLEDVTRSRALAISAGGDVAARATAENALTRSLRSLFAVAEAYPALKANENMLALQEELSSTENKIAFARQFYNDAVMEYNTARQIFPTNLVANVFRFSQAVLLSTEEADKKLPTVNF